MCCCRYISISLLLILFGHCFCIANVNNQKPIEINEISEFNIHAEKYNYRLPNNTKPEYYDITLITSIDRGEFDFSGTVKISIRILEDSSSITLHARQLTLTSIRLTDLMGVEIRLRPHIYDIVREFITITTDDVKLLVNQNYILTIAYIGVLREDTHGFYRSFYISEQGEKVYVSCIFVSNKPKKL